MASRKEWFAVIVSLALIGALVGLVILTRPAEQAQLLPLQPWYLHKNATLDWEVYRERFSGEPEEALVTHRVNEVANETIVLYRGARGTGGQILNETLSHEYMEKWYTTLATYISLQGLRIRNVIYRAEITQYDVGEHSFAALRESGSYESIGIGRIFVHERITDLTTFALLFVNETFRMDIPGLEHRWFNATWRLTSFQGIEPTAVDRMDVFEIRLETSSSPVHAFNVPDLSVEVHEGTVSIAFVSAQEALIASLIDMKSVPVLDVAPGNASQAMVPINATHSLLRVRTSSGNYQFTLTLDQEPAMIATPTILNPGSANVAGRPSRRSPSP